MKNVDKIYNKVFNKFFTNTKTLSGFVSSITDKIGTHVENKNLRVKIKTFNDTKSIAGKPLDTEKDTLKVQELIRLMFPFNHASIYNENMKFQIADGKGGITQNNEKLKLDLFTSESAVPGVGKVVIDLNAIGENTPWVNEILAQANISRVDKKNFKFPLFVTNKYNEIFKLQTINGENLHDQIIRNAVNHIGGNETARFALEGSEAVYILMSVTGTKNISNIGFSEKDGAELQTHAIASRPVFIEESAYVDPSQIEQNTVVDVESDSDDNFNSVNDEFLSINEDDQSSESEYNDEESEHEYNDDEEYDQEYEEYDQSGELPSEPTDKDIQNKINECLGGK